MVDSAHGSFTATIQRALFVLDEVAMSVSLLEATGEGKNASKLIKAMMKKQQQIILEQIVVYFLK
jgi:hypothetical protein